MNNTVTNKKRRQIVGTVVSDKMDKTATVSVTRYVKHPKYGKYMRITKKYKSHDPENTYKEGDRVVIEECAPISKEKRFRVVAKVVSSE
ncbi:MAG: 30S ribosomal protein S17 [Patescibacteria group bacterium]